MKFGDGGSAVEWHQDFAHYPHSNDDLSAVSIALDNATRENGCMMIVPGSHKGPILDHYQDGIFVGAVQSGARRSRLGVAVLLAMTAGPIPPLVFRQYSPCQCPNVDSVCPDNRTMSVF